MKPEDIHAKDIVKFKTRLLNGLVEDIGVVKDVSKDEYWNECDDWFAEVVPFNLKISMLLLKPYRIKRKLGEYSNFDFTNDETNHDFPIGYEFKLKLTDEFYRRYIDEVGYVYWNTPEEMKDSFKGLSEIDCMIEKFWGAHMYHIFTEVHDLRLTDKFIKEFSI